MKYYTFQPQFHTAITSLIKTSTIRPKQKVSVGERFALRHWLGSPYRSKMGWLGSAVCVQVAPITIDIGAYFAGSVEIKVNGVEIGQREFVALAAQEGFQSSDAMGQWFYDNHRMPFSGILTRWDPASFVAGEPS